MIEIHEAEQVTNEVASCPTSNQHYYIHLKNESLSETQKSQLNR